jgi:hypothetical protein
MKNKGLGHRGTFMRPEKTIAVPSEMTLSPETRIKQRTTLPVRHVERRISQTRYGRDIRRGRRWRPEAQIRRKDVGADIPLGRIEPPTRNSDLVLRIPESPEFVPLRTGKIQMKKMSGGNIVPPVKRCGTRKRHDIASLLILEDDVSLGIQDDTRLETLKGNSRKKGLI